MTRDQEIYKEVASLLKLAVLDISNPFHALVFLDENSVEKTCWNSMPNQTRVSVRLPSDASMKLGELLKELSSFYNANNMGSWNVVHVAFDAQKPSIDFDFDRCEELISGEKSLRTYLHGRFGPPRN